MQVPVRNLKKKSQNSLDRKERFRVEKEFNDSSEISNGVNIYNQNGEETGKTRLPEKEIRKFLEQQEVVLVYLFGSFARSQSHKESDVDIAVLFDRKVKASQYLKKEGELISFFSSFFPKKEINIVNLNISSPLLRQTVILEGELIYIKDEITRILFQVGTLREYEEYLHLSNIYNEILKQKIGSL